ncbi:MAG: DNA-3-methyladenine glycosylase 2 family protein [Gammaproteobacteria bacterium]
MVSQQVTTSAAAAIGGRLIKLCGGSVTWRKILNRTDTQLRACGPSRSKVGYVKGLAGMIKFKRLNLQQLETLDTDAAINKLIQVHGIGRWSAEIYLMFALDRGDIFPADDLTLQVAVQRYHNLPERLSRIETEELASKWSPERSAVALLTWKYYGATTLDWLSNSLCKLGDNMSSVE